KANDKPLHLLFGILKMQIILKGEDIMDLLTIFENKLKTDEQATDEFAKKWDQRAERFYIAQQTGRKTLQEDVVALLKSKGIITDESTVLDIGAGVGRYTIPFAKEVKHVYGTDFSSKMIEYLNRVKEEEQITNLSTRKLAWPTEEKVEKVDVAFSAMCPCTRSIEALKQMSKVAKNYGVLAQMTKMSDDVTDELINEGFVEIDPNDPHNNRDLAQGYFNILWELGFEPDINFVIDSYEAVLGKKEAIEFYNNRYKDVDETLIEGKIAKRLNNNQVIIKRTTRLAVISWSIK